ncbi:agouti-signaling protein-like [Salvelinus fontinalis]|uniref:agouti-signaling protein-like n=1 Tax=Salvelinus fontinalis TaxID=8038 RepID=UPI002485F7F9|nr:agouti-signaling protein-like [Salvelinus fontinalis]
MNSLFLLSCLSSTWFLLVYSHMVLEDALSTNKSSFSSIQNGSLSDAPPIVIVELPKTAKKKIKKPRKNKFSVKNKRPPPPANCVPLWGSCKTPNNVCCEYCAFCHCRLFKTVCYCRMGNPRC